LVSWLSSEEFIHGCINAGLVVFIEIVGVMSLAAIIQLFIKS
jgi:hypothetical protein